MRSCCMYHCPGAECGSEAAVDGRNREADDVVIGLSRDTDQEKSRENRD